MKVTTVLTIAAMVMATTARAATISAGNATALLGPSFFVDDAATTGGDAIFQDSSTPANIGGPRNWDMNGNAMIDAGDVGTPGAVTITGFGFASNASVTGNDATSVTLEFIYLGVNGAVGGGDDVSIGSATVGYTHTGAGEYAVVFDTPLSGAIDGANNKFVTRLTINDLNAGLQESVTMKTNPLMFESTSGAKLTVAGRFAAIPEPATMALAAVAAALGTACRYGARRKARG